MNFSPKSVTLLYYFGASVTWAHHAIVAGFKKEALFGLAVTTMFAAILTCLQGFEYYISVRFSMFDSVYGSVLFMATGFHGFHVIIDTIFLVICTFRLYLHHFSRQRHFGFEAGEGYRFG